MKKLLILIYLLNLFLIDCIYSQWPLLNYHLMHGNYDDCPNNNKLDFDLPEYFTTEADNSNTIIKLNLISSEIRANEYIKLNPGISIQSNCTNGNSYTLFGIPARAVCPLKILNSSNGRVKLHDKIELGLRPSNLILDAVYNFLTSTPGPSINPYNPDPLDPDYINITCSFSCLSNASHNKIVFGFFMRDYIADYIDNTWHEIPTNYPFRIRFAPDEVGLWEVKVSVESNIQDEGYVLDPNCSNSYNSTKYFYVDPNPGNNGIIEVGLHKRYLRFKDNPNPSFFPIAYNDAFPWFGPWQDYYLPQGQSLYMYSPLPDGYLFQYEKARKASENGVNYIRLNLGAQGYGIEWEQLGVYDKFQTEINTNSNIANNPYYGEFRNRQENAGELDKMMDLSEKNNFYIHAVLNWGDELNWINPWDGNDLRYAWPNSPYRTISNVNDPIDYYRSTDCRKFEIQKLRYILSRWGYSTRIASYELVNELNSIWGYNYSSFHTDYDIGLLTTADLIHNYFHDPHLISTSYATLSSASNTLYNNDLINFTDVHKYGDGKNINYEDRSDIIHDLENTYDKPAFMGELGLDDHNQPPEECADIAFQNAIWSTSFMGMASGNEWWDIVLPSNNGYGFLPNFIPLATFMRTIDFEDNKFASGKWRSYSFSIFGCSRHKNYTVENFYLKNYSKTRVAGWFHNATNYWANILIPCWTNYPTPCDDDSYNSPYVHNKSYIKITGLMWPKKRYHYDFYRTRGGTLYDLSSLYWRSGSRKTSWGGTLVIRVDDLDLDYYDDMAYKVYRGGYQFRTEESEEDTTGDYEMQFDTLCVSDTIFIESYYDEDSLHLNYYYWNFGNGNSSTEPQPFFFYETPGDYTAYVTVHDSMGDLLDSLGMYYSIFDCSEDDNMNRLNKDSQNVNVDNLEKFKITPNPNHGNFNIGNFDNLIYSFSIYDLENRLILNEININENVKYIDLERFKSGLYVLKITSNNNLQIFKIIKL